MTTAKAKARSRPPGDAVWRAVVGVADRVSAIEHALAPAFAAPKEKTAVPEPPNTVSGSGTRMDWSSYPDHDPDFMSGRITLEQAKARHPRPDEGCQCPNCTAERKRMAQRYAMPAPERQPARCPICHGSGLRGDALLTAGPQVMNWTPCRACAAEELFRLTGEAFHVRSEFGHPQMATMLRAARERVAGCTECQGTGKTWQNVPPAPCTACKGTGQDDHIVTPPGTLWRKAGGDYAKDTSGGTNVPEQRSYSTLTDAEPTGLPVPQAMPPDAEPAGQPWAIARSMGARITYPRGG